MRIEDIRQRLLAHGAKPIHVQRVLRLWAQAKPQEGGKRKPEDFLPLEVREALPAVLADMQGLARLRSEHPAEDGSCWSSWPTGKRSRACCCRAVGCACLRKSVAPWAACSA